MQIKLREVLDQRGKSIYQLNKETGIASSTLSRICNNKTSSIEFSVLDKICEALDCTVSDFLIPEKSNTLQ
jgi:putative transcriptional regulator